MEVTEEFLHDFIECLAGIKSSLDKTAESLSNIKADLHSVIRHEKGLFGEPKPENTGICIHHFRGSIEKEMAYYDEQDHN